MRPRTMSASELQESRVSAMNRPSTFFANVRRVPARARAWMLAVVDRGRDGAVIGSTLVSIQQ